MVPSWDHLNKSEGGEAHHRKVTSLVHVIGGGVLAPEMRPLSLWSGTIFELLSVNFSLLCVAFS
jgi:hypothetical protein